MYIERSFRPQHFQHHYHHFDIFKRNQSPPQHYPQHYPQHHQQHHPQHHQIQHPKQSQQNQQKHVATHHKNKNLRAPSSRNVIGTAQARLPKRKKNETFITPKIGSEAHSHTSMEENELLIEENSLLKDLQIAKQKIAQLQQAFIPPSDVPLTHQHQQPRRNRGKHKQETFERLNAPSNINRENGTSEQHIAYAVTKEHENGEEIGGRVEQKNDICEEERERNADDIRMIKELKLEIEESHQQVRRMMNELIRELKQKRKKKMEEEQQREIIQEPSPPTPKQKTRPQLVRHKSEKSLPSSSRFIGSDEEEDEAFKTQELESAKIYPVIQEV